MVVELSESQRLQLARMKLRSRIKTQTVIVAVVLFAATWGTWFLLSQEFFVRTSDGMPGLYSRRKADWPTISASVGLIALLVSFVALAGLVSWTFLRVRKAERRLARSLPRRIAHGKKLGVPDVAGLGSFGLWLLSTIGGIAIGLGIGLSADAAATRLIGFTYAAGVVVLGGLSLVLVRQVIEQPALADDERSLRTDDALRRKDAQLALVPAGIYLGLPMTSAVPEFAGGLWWFLVGYAAIILIGVLAARIRRSARRPPSTVL
ncbi:hypothetical protein [Amycolatopsis sp. EV170708-02-1]|uniref:hypothetical protein n=1 Tax=Amycolatopsis sp. EV170708-02-1 TaxID=2919322 RepID=UPI001F0BC2CE|nr:hypothetical protein [Amycolatopsis sp. EV170708-02-1]UMP01853.1 hypothetical protein MJQ72_36440 [Amycolatopsis sp. EV170708-02-1]